MKAFLLLTFALSPLFIIAQTDHFSNADSRWFVADTYPNGTMDDPNFVETKTKVFGFQGDSLFDGETWQKLYSSSDSLFIEDLEFEGLIKSTENKVLFKNNEEPIDTLYDFNLEVGEEFYFDLEMNPQAIAVANVDSVLINGEYYKRIEFNEPSGPNTFSVFNEVWIEGIGSLHGPLFPAYPRVFETEIPDSLTLSCSHTNEEIHWQNPFFDACFIDVSMGIGNLEKLEISAYPNPFSKSITIQSKSHSLPSVAIFNAQGQQVLKQNMDHPTQTLDVDELPSGVYFIQFSVGEDMLTRKMVKK